MQPVQPFSNFTAWNRAIFRLPFRHICKGLDLTTMFYQDNELNAFVVASPNFFVESALVVYHAVIHFLHILFPVNCQIRLFVNLIVPFVKFANFVFNSVLVKVCLYMVALLFTAVDYDFDKNTPPSISLATMRLIIMGGTDIPQM